MATPATNKQVPDHAILDHFNKQVYLGNRHSVILAVTSGGTSEVAEVLLSNPAVSAVSFPNQVALFVDLRRLVGQTASANNIVRVYLDPTVTDPGTPLVSHNLRPASTNAAVGVATSAPTVGANGTLVEALSSTAAATSESGELIILDPGHSVLITLQTAMSAVVDLQVSWSEI